MHFGAAEGFLAHVFSGHGLDHFRSGKEHVADTFGHDGKVGEGGGVDRAAGTGAENSGDLGDHAGCHDVALEDFSVTCQCVDTFLDACAAGVVETDDGSTHLHGHVHYFAYFQGHGFRQGAAEHGEVLCEYINQATVDSAVAGHHAVARVAFLFLSEVGAAVAHEHVEFFE